MTAAGDWSPYGPRHHRHQNPFRHHLIVGLTAGLMVGAAVGAAGTRLAFVLAMPSAFVCASLPVAPHGDARPVDWRALSGASTETKPAPKAQRREGGFINRPSGVPWVR